MVEEKINKEATLQHNTVEAFATNVVDNPAALAILGMLAVELPHYPCNFDLDDCDKIHRIESKQLRIILKVKPACKTRG
jgi:hypothetical protein